MTHILKVVLAIASVSLASAVFAQDSSTQVGIHHGPKNLFPTTETSQSASDLSTPHAQTPVAAEGQSQGTTGLGNVQQPTHSSVGVEGKPTQETPESSPVTPVEKPVVETQGQSSQGPQQTDNYQNNPQGSQSKPGLLGKPLKKIPKNFQPQNFQRPKS